MVAHAGYTDMWPLAISQGEFQYTLFYTKPKASLVPQMVKNLPAMQETWVQCLGREDILEKGTSTHSSILAWRIPMTEDPGRLQSMRSQNLDMTQ